MKIIIIGTSNSVMGVKGYLKSLSLVHDVTSLSCGRVSFFYHWMVIDKNRALIESADFLILDHYINDLNFYYPHFDEKYIEQFKDFLVYISSLNVNIVNLLFPIKGLRKQQKPAFYQTLLEMSELHRISVVDLNDFDLNENFFSDDIHLNHFASYVLGLALNDALRGLEECERPSGGRLKHNPYRFRHFSEFDKASVLQSWSTSIIKKEYILLSNPIYVETGTSERVVAIGYVRDKAEIQPSGLIFNGETRRGLFGQGSFLEMIDFELTTPFEVASIHGNNHSIKNFLERNGESEGDFLSAKLTDIVLFDPLRPLDVTAASREVLRLSLGTFVPMLEQLSGLYTAHSAVPTLKLPGRTIEFLRKTAVEFQQASPRFSYDLLSICTIFRPSGLGIKRLQSRIEERLATKKV